MRAYFDIMNENPDLARQFTEAMGNRPAQPDIDTDMPAPDSDSSDDELERKPEKLSDCMQVLHCGSH